MNLEYVLDASQSKGMVIYTKGGVNLKAPVKNKLGF